MTELNQQVSAVTREVVETGEPVRVTNRGRVVLRLVPEPHGEQGPLGALVSSGLATPPRREHRRGTHRVPVSLSRPIDDLLDEVNRDAEI